MCLCPRITPGRVSISSGRSVSNCAWAKRRTLAWQKSVSRTTAGSVRAMASATCAWLNSKLGGFHSSNFPLYRRTASSPFFSRSSSISETIRAVSGSRSNSRWPPSLKVFMAFL